MQTPPAVKDEDARPLREQISNLLSLFVLSMMMFARPDEEEILRLAMSSVSSLGPCEAVAGFRVLEDQLVPAPRGGRRLPPDLAEQVRRLDGADGAVSLTEGCWSQAYALRGFSGLCGYLVLECAVEPSTDQQFLLKVLSQQAGAALGNAWLHHREREHAAALVALNERLEATVTELEGRATIHRVLAQVSLSGEGEQGIARAVHELTGLPVAVEDRFGNLRAWAGPEAPAGASKPERRRRAQVLDEARRLGRPVRDRDRLIALAQPHREVLGVLALVDPEETAGPRERFALEHGALVLSMELAHSRSLGEMQLRLRRDLVDDLLTGTDSPSAYSRAEAVGHDLHRRHRVVVVVRGRSPGHEDALSRAVERAADRLEMGSLLGRRAGAVVLLAPRPDWWSHHERWEDLHQAVAAELRSTAVTMGVGGAVADPSGFPRSYEEATRAVAVRQGSSAPDGVTGFDDLGVFRLLASAGQSAGMELFVREWLGTLLDYDAAHQADLVNTLAQYCECGGSYDQTAEALGVHRSTLRYRLQRIRELSGHDITEVDTRFNLHAATRAWRILGGGSAAPPRP
jgi:sugar diacid utilization regulator